MQTGGPSSEPFEDDLVQLAASSPSLGARTAHCADGRVPRLAGPPTPESFRELISGSRPAIITGCVSDWPALAWTHGHLRKALGKQPVHVALTPDGLGDAVKRHDGQPVFAKPHEALMPFAEFVDAIETPLMDEAGEAPRRAVHYCSHQNSSLTAEFEALQADWRPLAWADAAFGTAPAATNFWMGEDASHTTAHADLFDNLYVVVRGEKRFSLLPPQEGRLLHRRLYPAATYRPAAAGSGGGGGSASGLELVLDDPPQRVAWTELDLEAEGQRGAGAEALPITATVRVGELLYLPALWWHAVSQRADESGSTIAINFWYDAGGM
jgi:jumonji domain-containing protein 7